MDDSTLFIDGIGLWSPALPGWAQGRAALRADAAPTDVGGGGGASVEADADAGADAGFDGDAGTDARTGADASVEAAAAAGSSTSVEASADASAASARTGARALSARPAPALLAANERRRAPDSVLLALDVASQAVAASGHGAATLASVFTSAHGDPAITDALCRTLAGNPLLLSPTRFHHSVHNAASGYWAIASGSGAASTALSAFQRSFAAGLLEAACQCAADGQPVLLVACDTAAVGALASVNQSRGALALALVLAPQRSAASQWALRWHLAPAAPGAAAAATAATAAAPGPALRSAAARALARNAMADGLPLFEALAGGAHARLALAVSCGLQLTLTLQPLQQAPDQPCAAPPQH